MSILFAIAIAALATYVKDADFISVLKSMWDIKDIPNGNAGPLVTYFLIIVDIIIIIRWWRRNH